MATFAQPEIIGLAYNYRLEMFITNAADQEFRQQCHSNMILFSNQPNSSVIFNNLEYYENEFAKELLIESGMLKFGDDNKNSKALSLLGTTNISKLKPTLPPSASTTKTKILSNEIKKMNIETYLLSIIKANHFNDRLNSSGGRLSSTTASESDECELFSIQSSQGNSNTPGINSKRLSSACDEMGVFNLSNSSNFGNNINCGGDGNNNNNNFNDSFNDFLKFNTPFKNNFLNNRNLTPDTVESSFVWHMGFGANNDDDVLHNYDYILKENCSNEEDDDDDDDITDFENNCNGKSSLVVKSYVDERIDDETNDGFEKNIDNLTLCDKENNNSEEDLEKYNSHQFWYIAPQNVEDVDTESSNNNNSNKNNNNNGNSKNNNNNYNNDDIENIQENLSSTPTMKEEESESVDSLRVSTVGNTCEKIVIDSENITSNKVLLNELHNPEEIEWTLIEDFVYMKDIDNNLCFKCAYNFPAVMLTLGRKFWPLLHQHFLSLCNDLQSNVRVRKTMAKSINQIALIIGSKYATKDLVAPFVEFFKDVDEIKVEVVKQIANFIRIVDPSKHELIIDQLEMCWLPKMNVINWRLREQIGLQVIEINKIVSKIHKKYCVLYLTGISLKLMMDKYDSVRKVGINAVSLVLSFN